MVCWIDTPGAKAVQQAKINLYAPKSIGNNLRQGTLTLAAAIAFVLVMSVAP